MPATIGEEQQEEPVVKASTEPGATVEKSMEAILKQATKDNLNFTFTTLYSVEIPTLVKESTINEPLIESSVRREKKLSAKLEVTDDTYIVGLPSLIRNNPLIITPFLPPPRKTTTSALLPSRAAVMSYRRRCSPSNFI
jgi:hypothetical protein